MKTAEKTKTVTKGKGKKGATTKGKGSGNGHTPRERNSFGDIVGSNNEKVRGALSAKPLSFTGIMEKTGLTRSQVRYSFLRKLVDEGVAVKTDDGWALGKGGKKKGK